MTMLDGSGSGAVAGAGSGVQRRGSAGPGGACPSGPSLSLPAVALGIELNDLANAL